MEEVQVPVRGEEDHPGPGEQHGGKPRRAEPVLHSPGLGDAPVAEERLVRPLQLEVVRGGHHERRGVAPAVTAPPRGGKEELGGEGVHAGGVRGAAALASEFAGGHVRVEHEGAETRAEKWICRIWRHQNVVNPPFGLPTTWEG